MLFKNQCNVGLFNDMRGFSRKMTKMVYLYIYWARNKIQVTKLIETYFVCVWKDFSSQKTKSIDKYRQVLFHTISFCAILL
jgi:DNA polymerase/3'-5' exonuclease PolX